MNESSEESQSIAPRQESPVNEIPGFLVRWLNEDGQEEEGPLSLLWKLIESYRVDIFYVSLIKITEDFLNFIHLAEDLQMEIASSFLTMATRLIYYKSKALLPDPGFEEPEGDPRLPAELVQQLLEYRRFQNAARNLQDVDDVASGMMTRQTGMTTIVVGDRHSEPEEYEVSDLIGAYQQFLNRINAEKEPPPGYEISLEHSSVEEKVAYVRALLVEMSEFYYHDLFENPLNPPPGERVLSLLALLEMTKLAEILVYQKTNFAEILIRKRLAVQVPPV